MNDRVSDSGCHPDLPTLLHLLRAGDVDAAIDAGLMQLPPAALAAVDTTERIMLTQVRQRLTAAWAARERFRARQARLQRRQCERQSRRAAVTAPGSGDVEAGNAPALSARPALPAAAAAALARARSRAAARAG